MNKTSQNTKEQYETPEIHNIEPFTVSGQDTNDSNTGYDGNSGGGGE